MKISVPKDKVPGSHFEKPILSLRPDEDDTTDHKDHTKCGSFKLRANPTDADSSKYSFSLPYVDGTQSVRSHLQWKTNVERVIIGLGIRDNGDAQYNLILQLCTGAALVAFTETFQTVHKENWTQAATAHANGLVRVRGEAEAALIARRAAAYIAFAEPDKTKEEVTAGLNGVIKAVTPYKGLEKQKRFMRRKMRKPTDMTIRLYVNHLTRLNDEELTKLPPFRPAAEQKLSEDEMKDIILFGVPKAWCKEMDRQNFDPFLQTIPQLTDFCERLEGAEDGPGDGKFQKQVSKKAKPGKKSGQPKGTPSDKWCEYHESDTHNTSECKTLAKMKNKDSKDNKSKSWKKQSDDAKTYTKKELHAIVKKEKAKIRKGFKAKKKTEDEDSDESVNMLDRDEAKAQQLADEAIDKELASYDAKDYDENGKQVSFDV